MNYKGHDVQLAQHNIDVGIPLVVSSRNYGVLWDNNSITRFGNPKPYALAGSDGDGLKVTGADGKPGWTAQYYLGDRLAVTQNEQVINYQYIRDNMRWPEAAKAQTVASTAGQNTAAEAILALAGADNALTGFDGYKPVTEEAVLAAAPDAILMMDRGGDHATAEADLWAMPALSGTPAAATGTLIRMEGLKLLGFGPRTPEAAQALHDALYGG